VFGTYHGASTTYHAQGFRLKAFQDFDVGRGSRAPELDTISPDRFEDGFV
jgi:hypothetical protein